MSFKFTTSGAAIVAAGVNANIIITASGAVLSKFSDQVENKINTITRYDWITNYTKINTNFKGILDNLAANMIGKKIINYDMSGYTSRTEAQTMLDVLKDDINEDIAILKEKANQDAMLS